MTGRVLNRWWVKAAAQGLLAAAPGATTLDDRLRRRLRPPRLATSYVLSKWQHVESHLRAVGHEPGTPLPATRVLELGTGWFPVVPVGLALHGATVVTLDRHDHLDAARVRLTLQVLSDLEAAGTIRTAAPERMTALREQLTAPGGRSARQLLEPLAVTPLVADAQAISGVPVTHGADLLVSNNTLEHIPAEILGGIFAEFLRVSAPGARMSHYIDLADHYAGFDPRLTEFHFLTLSPARWRLANNRLGYQNRLRLPDYHRLLVEAGWRVSGQELTSRHTRLLRELALVPPYDTMPTKDLLVVKAHLVADRRS